MKLKKITIINGISTNVGKTHLVCNILKHLFQTCKQINCIKPISSGFDFNNPEETDAGKMLIATGRSVTMQNIKAISPFILKAPTSPNIASNLEGVGLLYKDILEFCINSCKQDSPIVIEMAGGICTPITNEKTMLDLTSDITSAFKDNVHNILVTSNYLGSISHTISACKLFNFDEIIFNPIEKSEYNEAIKETIAKFTLVPLGGLEPPRA